jgi:hypothetical protein
MSAQFAQVGLPPRKRARKPPSGGIAKKARGASGPQIPRGFVTALAADSKFFGSSYATKACDTTGTITHLDIIPQGNGISARNGKSWQNTNIQIRGHFLAGSAAVTNHVAMYLVWDKQPNGALAAVTDVLDSASSLAFMKRENKGRFVTIKKWQRCLTGNTGTPATGREIVLYDKWIKLPADCIAQCAVGDASGVIANRVTGALLLVTVGDQAAGTAAASTSGQFRIGFKDPN